MAANAARHADRASKSVLLVTLAATWMCVRPGFCTYGAARGQGNLMQRTEAATARAAKGFGKEAQDDAAGGAEEAGSTQLLKDYAESQAEEEGRPKFILPGPPRPPSAPATYESISKIRLRSSPDFFAEFESLEIEKGVKFRVLQAKEVDGIRWLRTDSSYKQGWLLELGVAGKMRGKKVAKRIAGSLAAGRKAVHAVSTVDKENDSASSSSDKPSQKTWIPPEQASKPILRLLEDPKVIEVCGQLGFSVDDLKANPGFLKAVAKRIYGEDMMA
eukprot:TRINITY_DN23887_c0_g1_i1.p1 TRINITY_DN23887_c0_g1~~TRINITY_DN23887_c0_g1_i1.p1  ORF type:complete len:274 (-),score=60.29 TRINITY_DN23887_c0_g1_i1:111-932(-)